MVEHLLWCNDSSDQFLSHYFPRTSCTPYLVTKDNQRERIVVTVFQRTLIDNLISSETRQTRSWPRSQTTEYFGTFRSARRLKNVLTACDVPPMCDVCSNTMDLSPVFPSVSLPLSLSVCLSVSSFHSSVSLLSLSQSNTQSQDMWREFFLKRKEEGREKDSESTWQCLLCLGSCPHACLGCVTSCFPRMNVYTTTPPSLSHPLVPTLRHSLPSRSTRTFPPWPAAATYRKSLLWSQLFSLIRPSPSCAIPLNVVMQVPVASQNIQSSKAHTAKTKFLIQMRKAPQRLVKKRKKSGRTLGWKRRLRKMREFVCFSLLYTAGLFSTVGPHHHIVDTEGSLLVIWALWQW